jgi:hypothetical protein
MPVSFDSSLVGQSDDDSGANMAAAGNEPATATGAAGSPGSPAINQNGASPTNNSSISETTASTPPSTAAGEPVSNETRPTDISLPGKRLNNPLSEFASYTYQISLYMITPDAYDLFVQSGRQNINIFNTAAGAGPPSGGGGQSNTTQTDGPRGGGAFLIAQSGGINNTNEKRAAGFNYDYYIDNLSFDIETSGKAGGTATNISHISFTITEPYGFSFISNLRRASDAINQYSQNLANPPRNPSKQFFILGIRFYGYDQSGALVTPDYKFNGTPLDSTSTDNSLFEHFYDISVSNIQFKIDGKITTYHIEAVQIAPKTAFGVKYGLLKSGKSVTGGTVDEVLQAFVAALNEEQKNIQANDPSFKPPTYKINYSPDALIIKDSLIVSNADLNKARLPGSTATDTQNVSAAKEITTQPEGAKRNVVFGNNLPILQCIESTILQSRYLEDALTVVYDSNLEANKKGSYEQQTSATNRPVSWYTVSSDVQNPRWDDNQKEWVFDITYTINSYSTPVVTSAVVNSVSKYYGPHKRYEYWYTGLNNEIISYEQSLDNTFFNVVVGATDTDNNDPIKGSADVKNTQTPQGHQATSSGPANALGKEGQGASNQNSFVTSLYDPGSFATATIQILGDPDYLVENSSTNIQQVYSQFYGPDGFTINANGGQVFIEIDFKEGVDYVSEGGMNAGGQNTTQGGLLNINDSILFWQYPQSVSSIVKGISYQVTKVTSTFRNGSFKQTLDLVINDFGDPDAANKNPADVAAPQSANNNTSGPTTNSSSTTTPNTSPTKDPALQTKGFGTPSSPTGGAPPKQTPPVGNNET